MTSHPSPARFETLRASIDTLGAALSRRGFALTAPLRARWYNEGVDAAYALPDVGAGDDALAILVGNTRDLWPHFVDALQRRPERLDESDPLDAFVTEVIDEVVGEVVAAELSDLDVKYTIRWAWEEPPRRVSMVQLARASGAAWLAPCHLAIHQRFGPWFALRAVIVTNQPGPEGAAPASPACAHCQQGCALALEQVAAGARWQDWLAVRDACPTGADWRYSESQIQYHYTKQKSVLRKILKSNERSR